MERLTGTLRDRVVLVLAIIGLIFAVLPGVYVYPVDWVYELITGRVIVDVTVGLVTYIFSLSLLALITVSYAVTIMVTQKQLTKLSSVLIAVFIIQLVAVLVYSGAF